MTDYESALSELGSRLTDTQSPLGASLAEILADAIQELIEAEVTARIGAEPHERTLTRTTQRNGHRPKLVSTPAGDLEVKIPKLRTGQLLPGAARTAAADRQGPVGGDHDRLRHRDLDEEGRRPRQSAGLRLRASPSSTVSRICKHIDTDVAVLRTRIWAISRSCTSGSTPPMCMSATAARSSPKRS